MKKKCKQCKKLKSIEKFAHKGSSYCMSCVTSNWRKKNPEKNENSRKKFNIKRYKKRKNIRSKIFKILGSKCSKCGFDDIRALQIDHKLGGGRQEMKRYKRMGRFGMYDYYEKVLMELEKGTKKYQILCANCNWIKFKETLPFRLTGGNLKSPPTNL